jgi:uncharacterized membrane protein
MTEREDSRYVAGRDDVRGPGTEARTSRTVRRAPQGTGRVGREAEVPVARFTESSRVDGDKDERIANGLGWFSIGLGLAQIVAPGSLARMIGVNDDGKNRALMRAIGLREIAAGVGILSRSRPAGWVRARVGGDLMDLALLGGALWSPNSDKTKVAIATAAVAGVTAIDVVTTERLTDKGRGRSTRANRDKKAHVAKSITIKKSPEEVYAFWRSFENLPQFMYHLEEVRVIDDRRSHWVANAPAGASVEWDAEITEDVPNQRIAWRSLPDADVTSSGSVEFRRAPGDRGTELHVQIHYDPPAGKLGAIVAKLFGEEPSQQVGDDLRRLKQVLETGEVVRSEASPEGQGRPYMAQRAAKHVEEFPVPGS